MIEQRHSDRPFYGRYHHGLEFIIKEASVLRGTGTAKHPTWSDIVLRISSLREWRRMWSSRYGSILGTVSLPRLDDISEPDQDKLRRVYELLQDTDAEYKLVVSQDHVRIYSNDIDFLENLQINLPVYGQRFQIFIDRQPGTLIRKRSRYQSRCYFRNRVLTIQQKTHLAQYLRNQQDHIRISPTMERWLDPAGSAVGQHRLREWFFIDYDDKHVINMLEIIISGVKGKTLDLIANK